MQRHYNITVTGKVQGVYYRATAKKMADILELTGFAQNKSDGSVYLEIEGEEELVIKMIQWCHHGPDGAQVDRVSVTDGDLQGYSNFEIRR